MLPRVFEMFAQVDTTRTRARGGLGIGLTLARSLVHMHGGRIEVFSRGLGQGSEFVVRLPLAAVTVPLVTTAGMPPSRVSLTSRSIVIVDDAQAVLETLAELLAALGQQVRKASDAATALELVREHPPDLVISDIAMPDIDGHELARRIREMPQASGGRAGRSVRLWA